jgi:Uncharacterized protein conserved in bacteria (DUF2330)
MTTSRPKRSTRWLLPSAIVAGALLVTAAPAVACGGLVGVNGTIKLTRTTTLAAYHDGVERYVTAFDFSGSGKEVGSIVPLPGVPSKVQRGGNWTLQRLEREVAPPERFAAKAALADDVGMQGAQVLLQTTVDALDITILKGGGRAVGTWATEHGFLLPPDAPEMLDFYASRSPIFMAARFNAERAQRLGQNTGDGTPIMLTIPTSRPWVPLRILGLGLDKSRIVDADVFLLTDQRPSLLAGGRGLSLDRDEQASASLLSDLRIDKGMSWVPANMWFTYLRLQVPAGQLDYDLAVSVKPHTVPSLTDAGVTVARAHLVNPVHTKRVLWPLGVAAGVGIGTFALSGLFARRRRVGVGAPA